MIEPHTDCPPCPWCGLNVASPQATDGAGHAWDGRHATTDPRALWCSHCGCAWIEGDLDRVAQAWRAQAAWCVVAHEYMGAPVAPPPGITRTGSGPRKVAP